MKIQVSILLLILALTQVSCNTGNTPYRFRFYPVDESMEASVDSLDDPEYCGELNDYQLAWQIIISRSASDSCTVPQEPEDGVGVSAKYVGPKTGHTLLVYHDDECSSLHFSVDLDDVKEINQCLEAKIGGVLIGWVHFDIVDSASCFPGDSELALEDGSTVLMKNLKVGDVVETRYGFSPVYAFIDLKREKNTIFQQFSYYDHNNQMKHLKITEEHLMLVKKANMIKPEYLLASDVKEGDHIYIKSSDNESNMITAIIVKKEQTSQNGAYAPATLDGTLIVNGVIVSNYGIIDHNSAHTALFPLRAMHRFIPSWITHQEEGFQLYAKLLMDTYNSIFWKPFSFFIGSPSFQ